MLHGARGGHVWREEALLVTWEDGCLRKAEGCCMCCVGCSEGGVAREGGEERSDTDA